MRKRKKRNECSLATVYNPQGNTTHTHTHTHTRVREVGKRYLVLILEINFCFFLFCIIKQQEGMNVLPTSVYYRTVL